MRAGIADDRAAAKRKSRQRGDAAILHLSAASRRAEPGVLERARPRQPSSRAACECCALQVAEKRLALHAQR